MNQLVVLQYTKVSIYKSSFMNAQWRKNTS